MSICCGVLNPDLQHRCQSGGHTEIYISKTQKVNTTTLNSFPKFGIADHIEACAQPLIIPNMSITYHKATPSDAEGFAHCQIDSFMEDRFYQAAFGLKPDSQQEAYQEQLGYRIKRWQNRLDNPDIHWIKAVDQPTGAIVGICGCEVPEARRQRKDSKPSEEVQWPSGWDKQFLDLAERRTEEILEATGVEKEKLWCKSCHSRPFESMYLTGESEYRCGDDGSVAFASRPWHRSRPYGPWSATGGCGRRRYVSREHASSKEGL